MCRRVAALSRQLIELRVYIEAAIDFPEEEIDFLRTDEVRSRFAAIEMTLHELLAGARRGPRPREGLHVVLLGAPHVAPLAVRTGPGVGVAAAHDTPWRFWVAGSPAVSPYRPGRGAPATPRTGGGGSLT